MRAALLGACCLWCCKSASNGGDGDSGPPTAVAHDSKVLRLPGISVEAPAEFVKLETQLEENLRQSTSRNAPREARVEVAGLRAPGERLLDGAVHVQRILSRPSLKRSMSVREVLTLEVNAIEASFAQPGIRVLSSKTMEKQGGMEHCTILEASQRGERVSSHICSLSSMDETQQEIVVSVSCMVEPEREQLCRDIISSRRYEVSGALPFNKVLQASPVPGLQEISGRSLAWMEYGMSRDDFRAACRRVGEQVDGYDYDREPFRRRLVAAGATSRCSGFGAPLSIGEVVQVDAIFHEDSLASATWYLNRPLGDVRGELLRAYPDAQDIGERTLHVINTEAQADDLLSIMSSPATVQGSQCSVTVMSRTGAEMPPL